MVDFIIWVLTSIALAPYHLFLAITNPQMWLDWSDPEALVRFIYYGGSIEFFFVMLTGFLVITAVGVFWKRDFLWGMVRGLEGFANTVGRAAAWVGLIMVLQQVMIVFLQRIFRVADISMGPLGKAFTQDLSWWSEELKLYNAMIVCLCCTYTFVQGGHVRVDLVYSAVSHRAKKVIDMVGCMIFMVPAMVITYLYAWFFMWRHLVVPNPSSTSTLDRMLMQSRVLRWNVETIGFSPNGFNAYFLFKVLIVIFCVMVLLHAMAFFWRSYLEFVEGEESAGKFIDKDRMGDEAEDIAHEVHSGST